MKKLAILGAGTAGTIMANKLRSALKTDEWKITMVDQYRTHYYQPGFLFIPFGIYTPEDVVKPQADFIPEGVELIQAAIDRIVPEKNQVLLEAGQILNYDYLIVATGSKINPHEIEGLTGDGWQKNIFDFYTIEGATKLAEFFKTWEGGRLVLNVAEMPIKCPVAPLEFVFLADAFFTQKNMRDKVDIHYATPLPGAFTKPIASSVLGGILAEKNIKLTEEFNIARVDSKKNRIVGWDDRSLDYDVLVTIPTNMGDEAIARSCMGDELNFIPTDKHTLRSVKHENVFVIGDATNLPSSKAGSVAHFQAEILFENIMNAISGKPLEAKFDGHANCYIESGYGKAILIDFNYETEPLPGKFPLPVAGPFSLLKESRFNHLGKMAFKWMYWNLLLKGVELPIVKSAMSMTGKQLAEPKKPVEETVLT